MPKMAAAFSVAVLGFAGQTSGLQMGVRPTVMPSSRGAVQMAVSSPQKTQVEKLLDANRALVDSLASVAPDMSEIARLRVALAFPDAAEAKSNLVATTAWRAGKGRAIVESAADAVAKATAGGGWDNEPVREAAPHAAVINPYMNPKNVLTMSTDDGDLVYVIRASLIEDKEMMSKVSVDQLVEFLLYVKEVHSLVVNKRSEATGRLCNVIFANDITGTRKPPDPQFSKALTESSKSYQDLYPSLAGPTMILNLPFILQAFVGFFKPLFPKAVQAKLRFDKAPYLSKLGELTPLTKDAATRKGFLNEVANLLDDGFYGTKSRM